MRVLLESQLLRIVIVGKCLLFLTDHLNIFAFNMENYLQRETNSSI